LEAVTNGAWVVLDVDESNVAESDGFGTVSSLVEFVASGATSDSPLLFGGGGSLLSGGEAQTAESFSGEGSIGGVALTCESNDDVVKASSLLKSALYGGGLITTDSGILLQKSESDCDESNDTTKEKSKEILQSAVVLPFDAQLWKTAAFVFGNPDLL